MDESRRFTRGMLIAVWSVALVALLVWSLLAWAGQALVNGSGAELHALVEPWIAHATWDAHLATLLGWIEGAGEIALWTVWALGSLGLLLSTGFATLLYMRTQRAFSAAG